MLLVVAIERVSTMQLFGWEATVWLKRVPTDSANWWCRKNHQWATRFSHTQNNTCTTKREDLAESTNVVPIPFESQVRTSHNSKMLERGQLCLVRVVSFTYFLVGVVSFTYSLVRIVSLIRAISFAYSLVRVVSFAYSLQLSSVSFPFMTSWPRLPKAVDVLKLFDCHLWQVRPTGLFWTLLHDTIFMSIHIHNFTLIYFHWWNYN